MKEAEFKARVGAILNYKQSALNQCNLLYSEVVEAFLADLPIQRGVTYLAGAEKVVFTDFAVETKNGLTVTALANGQYKTIIYQKNTRLKLPRYEEDG